MPVCEICFTYFSHKPCPNCHPKMKIANRYIADKIKCKTFLLAPGTNELDFIWAQLSKKTIQRVQTGGQALRQGFYNFQFNDLDINYEWIGSTFSQGFFSRLEKLYPGTESILILSDVIAQNFNFNHLYDILADILNVNKRNLKNIFILWLEPYVNSVQNYENYKEDIKNLLIDFLIQKGISINIQEFSLPLYSSIRFAKELESILLKIVDVENLGSYFENKLPLRPLFRTQRPILDPNAPNRVILLDLEKSSSIEPVKKIKIDLQEKFESQKCLACSIELMQSFKVCLVCNFSFCNNCINYLEKESENLEDFCLGSIYHGLHRSSFI